MGQFSGNAFFFDKADVGAADLSGENSLLRSATAGFSAEDLKGKKIIVGRENFGSGAGEDAASDFLKNGVAAVVAQNFDKDFRQILFSKEIMAVEINKKEISDIFANFASKDATASISPSDEGLAKLKLISGSFSKSYQFRMDAQEKALLEK